MLRLRRFLSAVSAALLLALLGMGAMESIASPPAAADGCTEVVPGVGGGTIEIPVECEETSSGGGTGTGSGSGGGTSGGTRECTFAGAVVPCETDAGTWTGECYAELADPQPEPSNAIWGGRTDGVILVCSVPREGVGAGCVTDAACFRTSLIWAAAAPGATISPETLARQAVASMQLRTGQIGLTGGDPEGTGWRTVIGLPIWLWVDDPAPNTIGPVTATDADGGVSVTATATLDRIEWAMTGPHGVVSTTCSGSNAPGTAYNTAMGDQPSPTCGFQASQVQRIGSVTLSGTAYWSVEWAGGGQTGSFNVDTPAQSMRFEIIEVQAIRTDGG